jgi:hypothetical protein
MCRLPLKKVLYDEYEGFADKRIKHLERGSLYIVDDRSPGDYGADRQLFLWFCLIFADVLSETAVKITLRGGIPGAAPVKTWIAKNKVALAVTSKANLSFTIQSGQESKLVELADAIAAIVTPSKKYSVKAYKYVCPRTAGSLRRLARTLKLAWAAAEG